MFSTFRIALLLVLSFLVVTPVFAEDLDESMKVVMTRARDIALERGQWPVTVEHMTMALIESLGESETDHLATMKSKFLLTDSKLNDAGDALDLMIKVLPKNARKEGAEPYTAEAKALLKTAEKLARANKQTAVTPTHLLISMTDPSFPAPIAAAIAPMALNRETLLKVGEIAKTPGYASDGKEISYLARYTNDRSAAIHNGILNAPPLGFDQHIQTAMTTLNKPAKTANAPLLIGEGDLTEIADGLAFRINDGNVPDRLKGKRVLALDIEALKAGTKFRGALEQRVKKIITEASEAGDVILYVPNLERAMGGKDSEGGDITGPLRKALNEGGLMVLASTTAEGARKIEADTQLSQTMQKQNIPPMTDGMAFYYIAEAKKQWEEMYGIRISNKAISAAIEQSNRMLTGTQPRLAMDVLADAASRFSIEQHSSQPTAITGGLMQEIAALNAQRIEKAAEEQSRRRDGDLKKIDEELAKLNEKAAKLSASWERGIELQKEMKNYKWDDATHATRIEEIRVEMEGIRKETHLFAPELDERHVSEVVAAKTGRPSDKIGLTRRERVASLVPTLTERLIGQPNPIKEVGAVARKGAMGITSPKRPQGSFIFYGPTGVGKTELATILAEVLYDDPAALITIPGSEYMEKANLSKLLGAPPGYVGFENTTGKLEEVRQKPYSVVLFDEIEKFHPDIFKMLLEVMEKGKATDSHGRVIRFSNTIIIFTSNLGAEIAARTDLSDEEKNELMKEEFRKHGVPPEFVGRVYSKVPFGSLTLEHLSQIVGLELKKMSKDMFDPANIEVTVLDAARKKIAELGFDPFYGARPLRPSLGAYVETPVTNALVEHETEVEKSGRLEIGYDANDKHFTLSILKPDAKTLAEGEVRDCADYFRQIRYEAKPLKAEARPEAPAAQAAKPAPQQAVQPKKPSSLILPPGYDW
jgi:ATP-dependent Clp protease ATP-binding subunit ClpB